MKLSSEIKAQTTEIKKYEHNGVVHTERVDKKIKSLTASGEKIKKNSSTTKRFSDKIGSGWQTILLHGKALAPDQKTFIQSYDDGKASSWTETIKK